MLFTTKSTKGTKNEKSIIELDSGLRRNDGLFLRDLRALRGEKGP